MYETDQRNWINNVNSLGNKKRILFSLYFIHFHPHLCFHSHKCHFLFWSLLLSRGNWFDRNGQVLRQEHTKTPLFHLESAQFPPRAMLGFVFRCCNLCGEIFTWSPIYCMWLTTTHVRPEAATSVLPPARRREFVVCHNNDPGCLLFLSEGETGNHVSLPQEFLSTASFTLVCGQLLADKEMESVSGDILSVKWRDDHNIVSLTVRKGKLCLFVVGHCQLNGTLTGQWMVIGDPEWE